MNIPENAGQIEREITAYHVDYWNDVPVDKHYRQVVEEVGELGQALIQLSDYVSNNDFSDDDEVTRLKNKVAVECADVAITLIAVLIEVDKLHPQTRTLLYEEMYKKLQIINRRPKGNHKLEAYNNMKVLGDLLCQSEDANFDMILDKINDLLYTNGLNDAGKANANL